jgi:L,D-peptidoglycan transpeptidase YkuD (ErfK/YbiS/YcfS/YnhG family)
LPGSARACYALGVRRFLLLLPLCLLTPRPGQGSAPETEKKAPLASPIEAGSQQLILVRSIAWWASTGTLQRYERSSGGDWRPVGEAFPVDLGRSGMGWGRGLHQPWGRGGPVKREGDRRSPAGVYRLDTAFGAAESLPNGSQGYPYLQTRSTTYCVEDARSAHYNQLIDSTKVSPAAWEQWSEMARADGLFKWGVVVEQNSPEPQKGAGSCVFLHIWRGPNRPTAGCTAMAEDKLVAVLGWLDPARKPLLVQLPDPVLKEARSAWGLP